MNLERMGRLCKNVCMFLDAYNFTSLFLTFHHCVKYQNFTKFPGVGLWLKRTVFAEFWAFCPETLRKLCVSTKFPPGNLVTFRYFTQCVSTTGLLFCLNNLKGVTKLYVACSSLGRNQAVRCLFLIR